MPYNYDGNNLFICIGGMASPVLGNIKDLCKIYIKKCIIEFHQPYVISMYADMNMLCVL